MIFNLWGRQPEKVALLTREQAQTLIEAEIERQGWRHFSCRNYYLEQRRSDAIWYCQGFVGAKRGPVMLIALNAVTGQIIKAIAGGR